MNNSSAVKARLGYYQISKIANPLPHIEAFYSQGFTALGRNDLPPVTLSPPISWDDDVYSDRNWMFQLHGWRMLDAFFNRMEHSDVEFVSSVMSDWWQFYCTNPKATSWFWYDMSTGLRASKIAFFMVWCFENEVTQPLIKDTLLGLLEQHIAHLTNISELNFGNHGLFQLNGLLALVNAIERTNYCELQSETLEKAKQFAVTHMQTILTSQLGEHGVHSEDAPDYHFFALAKISQVLNAPWWQMDEMASARDMLECAEHAKYWFVTPSLHCPPIGDSAEVVKLKSVEGLRHWPHQQIDSSMAAQLDGYAVIRSTPEIELEDSHYLFFQGSFHSSGHKHCDCLSFIWQEGNRYRLFDSGKYGYQRNAMRAYFQSSRAHNTLEVDGKDFSRQKKDAYGSSIQAVEQVGEHWLVAGVVHHKALGVIHQRILLYKPSVGVDVLDRVINLTNKKRTYRLYWHIGDRADVKLLENSTQVFIDAQLDTILTQENTVGSIPEVEVYRGADEPRLQGWLSREYLKYVPSTVVEVKHETGATDFCMVSRWRLAGSDDGKTLEIKNGRVVAKSESLRERVESLFAHISNE